MKTLRLLKVTGKYIVQTLDTNILFCSFSAGVAIANAVVCLGGWHPFHFAMTLFGAASTLLVATLAFCLDRRYRHFETERNRTKKGHGAPGAPWISRSCNRQSRKTVRFCHSSRLP